MPAPYSDNLYSADTFSDDDENNFHHQQQHHGQTDEDALSPTDGYFHASSPPDNVVGAGGPHSSFDYPGSGYHNRGPTSSNVPSVPNVLVEDPTLRQQSGSAKANEAEQERLFNTSNHPSSHNVAASSPFSPNTSTQHHPHPHSHTTSRPAHAHRHSVDEGPVSSPNPTRVASTLAVNPSTQPQTLLADAPPAYSPPNASPQQAQQSGYQTFAPTPATTAMGVPEEQQFLLPRPPQSMGSPPDPQGPKPSFRQRATDSFTASNLRKKVKSALGVLVLLSIFLMVFSGFTIRPDHSKDYDVIGSDPVKSPKMDNNNLSWQRLSQCLNKPQSHQKMNFDLDIGSDRSLSIIQAIDKDHDNHRDGWNFHVSGEIRLRPTTDSSAGKAVVEIIKNDDDLRVDVLFDESTQTLQVLTPRRVPRWSHDSSPCVQVRITVWLPLNSLMDNLTVKSVHLDINVAEGLVVGTQGVSVIESVVGDVTTPTIKGKSDKEVVPYTLQSREIRIETVSGDISGWYPLYDLLKANSASGDIIIDIDPKAALDKSPASAVLDLASISGKVKASEPLDRGLKASRPDKEFELRNYVVKINTASGHVSGDLAIGSSAEFETISGDISLRLWPVLDSKLQGSGGSHSLKTETKSGNTKVNLLEPLWTSLANVGNDAPATPGATKPQMPPNDDDVEWAPADDDDPYLIIHPNDEDLSLPAVLPTDKVERRSNDDEDDATGVSTKDTPALSSLKSRHSSISGNIHLAYPASWEGQVYASTMTGNQKFRGEGLQITRRSGRVPRTLTGHKGDGNSDLKVETMSGNENFLVGKN